MKNYALIALLAALAAGVAGAQGNSAVYYWNMPTTASQLAFGAASLTMDQEPQGLMVNPAGLAYLKWRSLNSGGVQWWGDIYGGSVNGALPIKRAGALSAGLGFWTMGAIQAIDARGTPLGNISAEAVTGNLGYGCLLFDGLALGVNLKFSNFIMPQRRDLGLAADLGGEYRWRFLAANLQVRDIGPEYPVNSPNGSKLPTIFCAGVRAALWHDRIALAAQLNARTYERPCAALALEVTPIPLVSARLGYSNDRDKDQMSPLGVGLAIHTTGKQDYRVEYGFRSFGRLGDIHAVSLGMNF
ncbi:MAG TPA: hypothetical protein VMF29_08875 [Candidatus Edwardsbacteria bacterium]|nr:hypothetical protein [Candidatus Edwardsbacteria bacterium]